MPQCHNCGADVSPTAKFCSECGQDQLVSVPQDQRIQTEDVPVPPPPPPPPDSSPGGGWGKWLGVIAVLALLIIYAGQARDNTGSSQSESKARAEERSEKEEQRKEEQEQKKAEQEQKKAAPAKEVAQEDPNPNFRDGTHRVGSDIQPGTYRTREGSRGCYYERLAGFTNEMDDVLANGNVDGPMVIEILPTDAGFKSNRCGTWTQDLSQITKSKTSFDEGAYIIGTDIEPGTYRNNGSSGCYYQRLSGFSGDMDSVIANENADTPAVVTIAPTDAGFESHRCGTWTKIQ